ncbi:ParB/RepB/Spo0J family partition protein [Kitasatospora sp. MAA19]|uniref:ParB/RepB/Spo0J family partition protein n=1 Tax=Kitasatospora sp. MAA19 TaxID=3035090 RepID=UPI00247553DE|nr:ParB N-terminal domain-containing protein [Kitasatospora sp. MAA19]MDH6710515.1 ParB/RepB/Spo0J family partition protein [Kitasatospora sp. MAA19]
MAGRRVSFASMAADPVVDAPGVDSSANDTPARWVPTANCLPNPRNPRDELGDLSDLASIKDRQLQSCLAVTPEAYLRLWPEDRQALGAGPQDVVVVNGNRRRAAAQLYGREQLLVVVDDTVAESKATLLRAALDENMARKDFDPIEEANAVLLIVAQYPTAKEAAEAEGWSQSWISHRKNLLKLHPELQRQVRAKARGEEGVSINVARRLGSVKGIEEMSLAEQTAELEQLLQADADAVAEKRAARLEAKAAAKEAVTVAPAVSAPAAPAPQPAATPAPAAQPVADVTPAAAQPVVPPAPRPVPAPQAPLASAEPTPSADRFSAENSEPLPMPEQREKPAAATPQEELGDVDWHNVEELADAICRTLSADEAYRLADALANRLLTTSN